MPENLVDLDARLKELLSAPIADGGMRIEARADENVQSYVAAADIVNLFPTVLSAAINDLADRYENTEVEQVVTIMLDSLTAEGYDEDPPKFIRTVSNRLHVLSKQKPAVYEQLSHNVLMLMLTMYSIASKKGLRSRPANVAGRGLFQYCALLSILDKLSPSTVDMIENDLKDERLWGAE